MPPTDSLRAFTEPDHWGPATRYVVGKLLENWPSRRWYSVANLVGVSGGGDSVALAWALRLAQIQVALGNVDQPGKLFLAWFDHGLRPVTQERHCVQRLAESIGAEFLPGSIRTEKASSDGLPSESSLRDARHHFFIQCLKRTGARYLVLAHTFEDQVETVLQRLFRGTGVRGATGMRAFRPLDQDWVVVRPLLEVKRQELRSMLEELQQPYIEDPTNRDERWTRNWLRHGLIPRIEERFPGATAAVHRFSQQVTAYESALSVWATQIFERTCVMRSDVIEVASLAGSGLPSIVVTEMLRTAWRQQHWPELEMTEQHWNLLTDLCHQSSEHNDVKRTVDFPNQIRASWESGRLRIERTK